MADFEALQRSRRLLLAAAHESVELSDEEFDALVTPRPVWLPGTFLALPVAAAVGVTGLVTLDRSLVLIGIIASIAVLVVVTVAVAVSRVHRANTADDVVYPPAEEVIELRERNRHTSPSPRERPHAETPTPPPIPTDQSAAKSFSPVSSSASSRQPKI